MVEHARLARGTTISQNYHFDAYISTSIGSTRLNKRFNLISGARPEESCPKSVLTDGLAYYLIPTRYLIPISPFCLILLVRVHSKKQPWKKKNKVFFFTWDSRYSCVSRDSWHVSYLVRRQRSDHTSQCIKPWLGLGRDYTSYSKTRQ